MKLNIFLLSLIVFIGLVSASIFINEGNGSYDYGAIGTNHLITFTPNVTNLDWCWVEYDETNTTFFTDDMVLASSTGLSQTSSTSFVVGRTLTPPAKSYINNITFMGRSSTGSYTAYFYTTTYYNDSTISNSSEFSTALTSNTQYTVTDPGTKYVDKVEIYYRIANGAGLARMEEAYLNGYYMNCTNDVSSSLNVTLANPKTATVHANDTAGNLASETFTWDYRLLRLSESFNNNVLSGSVNPFTINFQTNGTPLTVAYLNYNGVNYLGTINSTGNYYTVTRNMLALSVTGSTNVPFYWNVTTGDGYYHAETSQDQTVLPLGISKVCAGNYTVFNLTLVDEITRTILSGVGANTSIKVDMNVYSSDRANLLTQFYTEFFQDNPAEICINSNMSAGEIYSVDLQIKYSADNYSEEFYHIERYVLQASSLNYNITLYDLETDKTQKFRLIVRDSAYLPIEGALVRIERKYIENGSFYVTEIPKTDARGITSASLQTNDVIYNFYIYKAGVLLSSFTNVRAICQTPLVSECEIDFNAVSSTITIPDYEEGDDFNYTLGYNHTTRTITSQFVIPSGEPSTILLSVTTFDSLGTSVCTDTITSASGTLSCVVPDSFGNSTVIARLYKDGVQVGYGTIKLDQLTQDIFGVIIVMISVLVFLTLIGLGISDNPVVTAVFLFVGVILLVALNLVQSTGYFGAGATILFLAIALIMIIIKASRRT